MGNSTATLPSYDLLDAPDPLAQLLEISARSPLSRVPALGAYLVTGHEHVLAALRDDGLAATTATRVFDRLPRRRGRRWRRFDCRSTCGWGTPPRRATTGSSNCSSATSPRRRSTVSGHRCGR
ncbi:hypothetical protein [Actinophytocola sediminis]